MRKMIPSKFIAWIKKLFKHINQDGNTTEIGGNLEVDGVLKASGGEEVITDIQAVIDEGNPQLNLKQGETIVNITDINPLLANGEKMTGYSFNKNDNANINYIYAGVSKNGNKLTIVEFVEITLSESTSYLYLGDFVIPTDVHNKLYPYDIGNVTNVLENKLLHAYDTQTSKVACDAFIQKIVVGDPRLRALVYLSNLVVGTTYKVRIEATFLLSDNLVAQ